MSREGFLGRDKRPLGEIIDADSSELAGLEVTHQQISNRMGEILDRAMSAMGREVRISADLKAVWLDARGVVPCPWGACGRFDKGQVELTHLPSGRTLRFSPLSVHMIAEHGFFQGRGSPFRAEPADLCSILDIQPRSG